MAQRAVGVDQTGGDLGATDIECENDRHQSSPSVPGARTAMRTAVE